MTIGNNLNNSEDKVTGIAPGGPIKTFSRRFELATGPGALRSYSSSWKCRARARFPSALTETSRKPGVSTNQPCC